MKILAIQLKRIGDLILTTPALQFLREAAPEAEISLAVAHGSHELAPAVAPVNDILALPRGASAHWGRVVLSRYDLCLDFTGTDRSALLTALSTASRRLGFDWVRRSAARALAYNEFVPSPVRELHTVDHYLDLARAGVPEGQATASTRPTLRLPPSASDRAAAFLHDLPDDRPYAILHPGSARREKYWLAERWAEVAAHLIRTQGLRCIITGGMDPMETAHLSELQRRLGEMELPAASWQCLAGHVDLPTTAALVERAALVISADTAVVHLAAAFETPQIALFGPTNPFHWRPRHPAALILSAAQPEAPLQKFTPRMKGAPMERISTAAVIRATTELLAGRLANVHPF